MKNKAKLITNRARLKGSQIMWIALVMYIALSNIVNQLFGIEASRLSGILVLMPVLIMLAVKVLSSRGKVIFRFTYYHLYILLFGLFCLASSLWAQSPELSMSKGIDIIEIFVIMCIISICYPRQDSVEAILKAVMVGYYIVVFYEILFYGWSYFITVMQDSVRVSSDYLNANVLGMCAAVAIFINLYLLIAKKLPVWTIALMVVSVVVIFASGSRKALVVLFLGIFLYWLFYSLRKRQRVRSLLRFLIALPILVLILYRLLQLPMFAGLMERMEGLLNVIRGGTVEKSAMLRMSLVDLGIKLFRQHPLLGIGIDNTRLFTFAVTGESYYLHNNYMEILASGGIVGFVLYYWIYVRLLVTFIRRRKLDDRLFCACFALFIVLMVMDYGMVTYYDKTTYIYIFVFVTHARHLKAVRRSRRAVAMVDVCGSQMVTEGGNHAQ